MEPTPRIVLSGVHAYAEKVISAGQSINFRVSSDIPYTITVARLGSDADGSSGDVELFPRRRVRSPQTQPIFPGSFVQAGTPLPDVPLAAVTLECWVRPTGQDAQWQGLISQHSFPTQCGLGLFLTPGREVLLYLGTGLDFDDSRMVLSPEGLSLDEWHHVVGVWDGRVVSLWIDGQLVSGPFPLEGRVQPGLATLRLAAYGDGGLTRNFLDGDLAMPVIYSRALSEQEIVDRFKDKGLHPPQPNGVLACWPLSEERGTRVNDSSGNGHHGTVINRGTWMIGGPSFDSQDESRFPDGYDPATDALRGHGLRFASDDLYDCKWQSNSTHRFDIPSDAKPGIYVGRILYGDGNVYDVTFVVKRPRTSAERAPLLVLCATNTWLAYSATPFAPRTAPDAVWFPGGIDGSSVNPAVDTFGLEPPRYDLYLNHRRGQPTYRMGWNMPWPAAGPFVRYHAIADYSHLVRAERALHVWLEENGFDFDVVTDMDLHRDPTVLLDYPVVLIGGHSEYWTEPAYRGVERFLAQGGKLVVLSGNTMFWRVSYDADLSTMECRKSELLGIAGGLSMAHLGECYHSDDGRRGGLMRQCGIPAWKLIGMESVGFINDEAAHLDYVCVDPEHPFFTDTGLIQGDSFAPGAVGHEWDIRVDALQQGTTGIRAAELPQGVVTLAQRTASPSDTVWNYAMDGVSPQDDILISQVIHWPRPAGGEVFVAGTIGAGLSLKNDERWGTVLRNVLAHFGL